MKMGEGQWVGWLAWRKVQIEYVKPNCKSCFLRTTVSSLCMGRGCRPPAHQPTGSQVKRISVANATESVRPRVGRWASLSHSLTPFFSFTLALAKLTLSLYSPLSLSLTQRSFKYAPVLLKPAKKYFSLPTDECVANVCVCSHITNTNTHTATLTATGWRVKWGEGQVRQPACRPRHLKKANLIVNHDKSQFLI